MEYVEDKNNSSSSHLCGIGDEDEEDNLNIIQLILLKFWNLRVNFFVKLDQNLLISRMEILFKCNLPQVPPSSDSV